MSTLLPSASATPFVIRGTATTPPEPLDAVAPGPSRLIQPSMVNVLAPSPRAGPNVTRFVLPLNFNALLVTAAFTVTVTLALALAFPSSVAARFSTYVPAAEKVAVVASALAFENVTVPDPLTLLHKTEATVPSMSLAVPASDAVAGSRIG